MDSSLEDLFQFKTLTLTPNPHPTLRDKLKKRDKDTTRQIEKGEKKKTESKTLKVRDGQKEWYNTESASNSGV